MYYYFLQLTVYSVEEHHRYQNSLGSNISNKNLLAGINAIT